MAVTFQWAKTYGASPGTRANLGASGNLFNFMDLDSNTASAYALNPVHAGENSYEVWLQGCWPTDSEWNTIGNLQFWQSTNFAPSGGVSVKFGTATGYATPVKTTSTVASASVATADPGEANVTIGGAASGQLSASGYSDYIILQGQLGAATEEGDRTTDAIWSLQYDVS